MTILGLILQFAVCGRSANLYVCLSVYLSGRSGMRDNNNNGEKGGRKKKRKEKKGKGKRLLLLFSISQDRTGPARHRRKMR